MTQHSTTSSASAKRMPCRGCLPNCPNYATCDGKPWRADKAAASAKARSRALA